MNDEETFLQLPLTLDPSSKAITSTDPSLTAELTQLNTLHRLLLTLDTSVPPPPLPINPKRSAQIVKLRDTAALAAKKSNHAEALRLYTLAINMASTRPPWEPVGLVRDELAGLYERRAGVSMGMQDWVQGAADAECSIQCKKVGNSGGWVKRGRCLVEMGRLEEAKTWVEKGLEVEGSGEGRKELDGLKSEIEKGLAKEGRR
jgi:translocation protein SEC72